MHYHKIFGTLTNQIIFILILQPTFAYETEDNELNGTQQKDDQNNSPLMVTCTNNPRPTNRTKIEHFQEIGWWFDSVLHTTICVVGLIANLVSIVVLLSHHLTNVFYRTLAFLALFDFLFITCDLLESIRRGYQHHDCETIPYYQTIHLLLFPTFLRPLQSISMMASTYTTIVVALGRYLAVSKPISTMVNNVKGSWKTVMKYVLPVVVFSIIFKFPIFFEFFTKRCNESCTDNQNNEQSFSSFNDTEGNDKGSSYSLRLCRAKFRESPDYVLYYINIGHLMITGLIPLISLIILNCLVYKHLIERRRQTEILGLQIASNRSKQLMNSQIATENRQAHIVFGVVLLFFVGCILRIVLNVEEIHQELTRDKNCGYVTKEWIYLVGPLQRLLLALSHSGNLFIYCLSSDKFRDVLLVLLGCRKQLTRRNTETTKATIELQTLAKV